MKKALILITLFLIALPTFSQKKEKIKGSKIVTIQKKQIESFNSVEILDNLEVFLVKGNECGIEIEADDNLHEAIEIVVHGNILRVATLKNIVGAKKLSLRITYTNDFKEITARNEATVSIIEFLELDAITIKSFDYAELFINAKPKTFNLSMNDKSKAELNLKAENSTISLSKNATLKALIASENLIFDMYQKSEANIEGDTNNLKLRLDNNAQFTGKNFACKNVNLTTEAYSKASLFAKDNITISALAKSEIQLYGDPKIAITQFLDSAILMKKPSK
jgi:putative N-acetylmannosamine-6-phosphate epimerase